MFSKLGRIMKKSENLSITSINVHQEGQDIKLTHKKDIELAIIDKNKQKYHQTEGYCPFLQEPLLSDFGLYREGPATDQVLKGTYSCPDTVDDYTKDYIKLCKSSTPQTNLKRTAEDFRSGWKKTDEITSSRHLHFRHFKAACKNEVNTLVHYTMAEIPFCTGYAPQR
jgi:hypothetical protein